MPPALLAAAALAAAAPSITVTAAREPVPAITAGAALTIIDRPTIEALDLPLAVDILRLTPAAAVATSGGLGAQTQVRLRGAEANHTLVFIDGIEMNDPASSAEFRFETLLAEGLEHVEVLRGPQSALWGSEAIGGVVSITTLVPRAGTQASVSAQAGSLDTYRTSATAAAGTDAGGLSATAAYLTSDGIDVSGWGGDRDGYENLTLAAKAVLTPAADGELGAIVRYTDATSRFDDFDFATGGAADAPLATTVQNLALRAYGRAELAGGRWSHQLDGTYLDTRNRNRVAGAPQNRSDGARFKAAYQTSLRFTTSGLRHRATAAAEHEQQSFRARDVDPQALSNQRATREQTSFIAEHRLELPDRLAVSASVRRDWNDRFADATTWRAAGTALLPAGFLLHASYGEGVTDPTFFELFGFFPDFFVGNPALTPERATGWDAGLGWSSDRINLDATYFEAELTDEIIGTFDLDTFLASVANAGGISRRRGVELTAEAQPLAWLRLAATYTWLDADQQQTTGGDPVREARRPEHSGALTAIATRGSAQLAAAIAYVGDRRDTNFATLAPVTLGDYALATLSARVPLTSAFALTARVENAFDTRYQDVFGYRTQGLTAHAGLALRLGR